MLGRAPLPASEAGKANLPTGARKWLRRRDLDEPPLASNGHPYRKSARRFTGGLTELEVEANTFLAKQGLRLTRHPHAS